MTENMQLKFGTYPANIQPLLFDLRALIFDTVKEESLGLIEESLKWGEPSYLVKAGSPIRIDWKQNTPNQYAMYFSCNTVLVETFKELYSGQLNFEGKRAIIFDINERLPKKLLKHCISMALNYKKLKRLPMLGN